ncbi:MAG: N(5)-(carboxyethyl)ornithine synthase [Phaeodactylibacter sp.]|nr:N(5)-(carboxyethyl)ornithine synthase [Phaeodactylibacter sp.]MCB9267031.1 alanine dehydrogenase [Lewinellaceae bacterium]MCB9289316.1 alanine dehydrogenase [Lewinellaceae bacterium]
MALLTVGVFGTSSKENEKRVPVHPDQLSWIDEEVRSHLFFEENYGAEFGVEDDYFASLSAGVLPREELIRRCDIALLPKPVLADFKQMKEGGILWGWPHCVQQKAFTQAAIDKRLTLIAWEAMHKWWPNGDWQMHIFHKNNELAGYAGVLHALSLAGIDGNYGPHRKAVVISFGSVSRGAIFALKGRGIHDITVYTQRYATLVADQITGVEYLHFEDTQEEGMLSVHPEGHSVPFIEELAEADIIVNGILQDTDHPLMFIKKGEEGRLKPGCLIVDISCDEGMGFFFARPTSFENPMLKVRKAYYYGVDHTPSYLWNSASWEISSSLLPYLPIIMGGPESWESTQTVWKAIEIRDGIIQNPKILSFQKREAEYPHRIIPSAMTV